MAADQVPPPPGSAAVLLFAFDCKTDAEVDEWVRATLDEYVRGLPIPLTDRWRARLIRRKQNALAELGVFQKVQLETERETQATRTWVETNRLELRCRVEVVRGKHKRRRGIVMPFGQRPGEVLVGLDECAHVKQELARMPRSFVRFIAPPEKPPPSAISADGKLSMDDLWKHVGQSQKLGYAGG